MPIVILLFAFSASAQQIKSTFYTTNTTATVLQSLFRSLWTNGVAVSDSATNLDVVTGSNTLVLATNSNGKVSVQINAVIPAGTPGLTTNENQFLGVPLSLKSGAFQTNFNGFLPGTNHSNFRVEGDFVMSSGDATLGGGLFPDLDDNRIIGNSGQAWLEAFLKSGGLHLVESVGSDNISLVSPALAGSYSLMLPNAQGADGTVITNNGSGLLGWWNAPAVIIANDTTTSNGAIAFALSASNSVRLVAGLDATNHANSILQSATNYTLTASNGVRLVAGLDATNHANAILQSATNYANGVTNSSIVRQTELTTASNAIVSLLVANDTTTSNGLVTLIDGKIDELNGVGTNTFFASSDTNRTNVVLRQTTGQSVPVFSMRDSNGAPVVEIDNRGFLIITNSLTNRVNAPTNTIALGVGDYGGLSFPRWSEANGLDFTIQPSIAHEQTYWLGTFTGAILGSEGIAPVTNGGTTITHTTPTERQQRMVDLATPATSNGTASAWASADLANAGAHNGSSKIGGYFYGATWCCTNLIGQVVGGGAPRTFIGLTARATEDYTNIVVATNATGQYVGLMCDAKQSTNMFLTARDSSAEFRTNTGIPFIATNVYKFYLFNAPTSRFVGWRLDDTYEGSSVSGWFSNNVPTNFMKFGIMTRNGTNRAHSIRYSRLYLQAPLKP